jgi:hypothetical protein
MPREYHENGTVIEAALLALEATLGPIYKLEAGGIKVTHKGVWMDGCKYRRGDFALMKRRDVRTETTTSYRDNGTWKWKLWDVEHALHMNADGTRRCVFAKLDDSSMPVLSFRNDSLCRIVLEAMRLVYDQLQPFLTHEEFAMLEALDKAGSREIDFRRGPTRQLTTERIHVECDIEDMYGTIYQQVAGTVYSRGTPYECHIKRSPWVRRREAVLSWAILDDI